MLVYSNLKVCPEKLSSEKLSSEKLRQGDLVLTLCTSKRTFATSFVSWLGSSADTKYIAAVLQAGFPERIEEARSLLQACKFNAKFTWTNVQIIKSLRKFAKKTPNKFIWNQDVKIHTEQLQSLCEVKPWTLPERQIYQEPTTAWVPIEHTSCWILTQCYTKIPLYGERECYVLERLRQLQITSY